MAYDFEKDASAKSFELELDNDTIMTAFITTDEEADGTLPELSDGVYGGIGYGYMGPDFEFLGSGGGGGSGDFTTAVMTVVPESVTMIVPFAYDGENEHGLVASQNGFEAGTYNIVLYKGQCVFEMPQGYTVTGNAVDNEGIIVVSGDFSVIETQ